MGFKSLKPGETKSVLEISDFSGMGGLERGGEERQLRQLLESYYYSAIQVSEL